MKPEDCVNENFLKQFKDGMIKRSCPLMVQLYKRGVEKMQKVELDCPTPRLRETR